MGPVEEMLLALYHGEIQKGLSIFKKLRATDKNDERVEIINCLRDYFDVCEDPEIYAQVGRLLINFVLACPEEVQERTRRNI